MLKYEHIAKQLNAFIHQSNFKPAKLPNVTQLKERYQVSKSTIIKALRLIGTRWFDLSSTRQWYLCEEYLETAQFVSTSLRLMVSLKV